MRVIPFVAAWAAVWCAATLARGMDTRLPDAAENGDCAAVKTLISEGVDVNSPQADGMTALHWGAYRDDEELVRRCLAAGANARATNRYGVTPLSLACTNGSETIVELLLDANADPNSSLAGGETVLMTAARTGRRGPVVALIARGAEVNAREEKGQTAIMWAAAEGHVDVVDALLDAGADFRTPLRSGFTPLFFAAREGHTEVIKRLLEACADVNEVMRPARSRAGGITALILAVENGHYELAAGLLDLGADPNARPAGYTALHAITTARKPIRGDGNPPPVGSGTMDSLQLVRLLVRHGADVNARLEDGTSGRGRFTTTGSTPFLLAARAGDVPLMRVLLELHADPCLPNADHCTPLLAACGVGALGDGDEAAATEEEAIAAVKLLLELGADVNAVDDNGETAMHGAAYQDRSQLISLLVDRGADVKVWDRPNKSGWTPMLIALGHRPGNFRPEPDTIAALKKILGAGSAADVLREVPVSEYANGTSAEPPGQ